MFFGFLLAVIPGDYYRALYSYNPAINSPNQEAGIDEELTFEEDDIIIVSVPMVTRQYIYYTYDGTMDWDCIIIQAWNITVATMPTFIRFLCDSRSLDQSVVTIKSLESSVQYAC